MDSSLHSGSQGTSNFLQNGMIFTKFTQRITVFTEGPEWNEGQRNIRKIATEGWAR